MEKAKEHGWSAVDLAVHCLTSKEEPEADFIIRSFENRGKPKDEEKRIKKTKLELAFIFSYVVKEFLLSCGLENVWHYCEGKQPTNMRTEVARILGQKKHVNPITDLNLMCFFNKMYEAYKKILIQYSALNTFQLHYLTIVGNFYLHWKCVTKYYRPVKSQYKPRKSKYGTRELQSGHTFLV